MCRRREAFNVSPRSFPSTKVITAHSHHRLWAQCWSVCSVQGWESCRAAWSGGKGFRDISPPGRACWNTWLLWVCPVRHWKLSRIEPAQRFWIIYTKVWLSHGGKVSPYILSGHPLTPFMATVLFCDHTSQWRVSFCLLNKLFVSTGRLLVGCFCFPLAWRSPVSSPLSHIARRILVALILVYAVHQHPCVWGHKTGQNNCHVAWPVPAKEEWNCIVIHHSKFKENLVGNIFSPLWFSI